MGITFQPSFDDLSVPLFDVTFCVLDLETTGGSPSDCEITEIGAVKYRGGELVGTYQTLVDPGTPIPPTITILTGITEAMVVDAPRIETALPQFLEFIGESVIVGHNVRFDLSFLNASLTRHGYERLRNKSVDTAALARRLVRSEVRNLRLLTLARHFRSPVTPNHRALEDARATAHVLHGLLERVGSLGVTNLDDLLQLPTAKGSTHYPKIAMTEHLPRSPGVYLFKDRHGTPFYVGKATNLRARVRQYFYGDTRRTVANMMRELESISHITTTSVLEAEIIELRLIHTHRPRYNRRSRPPKTSQFVKLTAEKYPRLSIVRSTKTSALAYLGPFRSKRTADLVAEAIWDAIPLRRCRSRPGSRSGKCASAQLGVAQCPCDGMLAEGEYRNVVARFLTAIETEPSLLLEPLVERMVRMSNERRYEDAAWVRDRHDALARALERRHRWLSLTQAGLIEIEASDGTVLVIDHGRLIESRNAGTTKGILANLPAPGGPLEVDPVPPDVQHAEEAELIWKWLETEPVVLRSATGNLALPRQRVAKLTFDRSRAA